MSKNSRGIGKYGELQVMAWFMDREYLETFMPVLDCGIDLVVKNKKGNFVPIQVKTQTVSEDGEYSTSNISKQEIDDFQNGVYVFVVRKEKEVNYILMPANWIFKHSRKELKKHQLHCGKDGLVRFGFEINEKSAYYDWSKKKRFEVTKFLNNPSVIDEV